MGLVKRGNVWWMNLIFQGQRIRRSTGTTNRALAESIIAKVKVQLIEGQYFDRLEEKTRTFDELMDRFEREHLVKLASRQTGQVFVKRFRAFFGGRTLAEITPSVARKGRQQTRPLADGRRGSTIACRLSVMVARTGGVGAAYRDAPG